MTRGFVKPKMAQKMTRRGVSRLHQGRNHPKISVMRRDVLTAVVVISALSICGTAQTAKNLQPSGIKVEETEAYNHLNGDCGPIRTAHFDMQTMFQAPEVELIVSPEGTVLSANSEEPDLDLRSRVEDVAVKCRFKPFLRRGVAQQAKVKIQIGLAPLEALPKVHVTFPRVTDIKEVKMTLSRSTCFGECPAYSVSVRGDGEVTYSGGRFVFLKGTHKGNIGQEAALKLLAEFKRADFFSLADSYSASITDHPTNTLSISVGSSSKTVVDYVGTMVGMPEAVADLEETFDRIVGTERWTKGNSESMEVLRSEGFDFRFKEAGESLIGAAEMGTEDVVIAMVREGAPVDAVVKVGWSGCSALECAAGRGFKDAVQALIAAGASVKGRSRALARAAEFGRLEVVKILLAAGASVEASDPKSTTPLQAAASSARPDIVAEVLKYGPEINATSGPDTATPLILAVESNLPNRDPEWVDRFETVRLLLSAGADVHAIDSYGNTALHYATDAAIAEALIKAGANVNAQNDRGETPLFDADPEIVRLLLLRGADLNAINKSGKSARQVLLEKNDAQLTALVAASESGTLR